MTEPTSEEADDPEGDGPQDDGRPSPPMHLVARSAIAATVAVVATLAVVLGVAHDLPGELLGLVERYFDWLFGVVG